jgi:hypothetical protein
MRALYDLHIPFVAIFLAFAATFAIVHWSQERRR